MGGKQIKYKNGDTVGECVFIHMIESKNNLRRAIFQCKCGKEFEAAIKYVKNGTTKSCGCLQPRIFKEMITKHGIRHTKEYHRWLNIKDRCLNPNNPRYKDYGARGITICDEWINDPVAFCVYIKSLPDYGKDGYTLDRENNDGNYEPGNLRWADSHTQQANKRKKENCTSKYIGVHFRKEANKWISRVNTTNKDVYLGRFDNEEDAVNARNNYIIKNGLWEYDIQLAEVT